MEDVPPADPTDEHVRWVASLPLDDVVRYCRAFGRTWFAANGKEECQRIARKAVERSRHVGPGSTISDEVEQPYGDAPVCCDVANRQAGQGRQSVIGTSRPSAEARVERTTTCVVFVCCAREHSWFMAERRADKLQRPACKLRIHRYIATAVRRPRRGALQRRPGH